MASSHRINRNFCEIHRCTLPGIVETPCPAPYAPFRHKLAHKIKLCLVAHDHYHRTSHYFRSRSALHKERSRQLRIALPKFTIHPFSLFAIYRELALTILWRLTFIIAPLQNSFLSDFIVEFASSEALNLIQFIVNVLLMIDILILLHMGYPAMRGIVLDRGRARRRYLCTFFIIDFVPTSYNLVLFAVRRTQLRQPMLLLPLNFVRSFRLLTIVKYDRNLLTYIGAGDALIRIIAILSTSALIVHWATCFLVFLPTANYYHTNHFGQSTILRLVVGMERSQINLYLEVFFGVLCHFVGAGEGTIIYPNPSESLILCVVVLIGMAFVMYSAAIYLQLFGAINVSENKFNELVYELEQYMELKNAPKPMKKRIKDYFVYKYERKYFNEKVILSTLSEHLRGEVQLYAGQKLFYMGGAFKGLSRSCQGMIMNYLQMEIFMVDDVVARCDESMTRVFFVYHGTVKGSTPIGTEMAHYEDGSNFGFLAYVQQHEFNNMYRLNYVALETTSVFYIGAQHLELLFGRCPTFREFMYSTLEKMWTRYLRTLQCEQGGSDFRDEILVELALGRILDQGKRRRSCYVNMPEM